MNSDATIHRSRRISPTLPNECGGQNFPLHFFSPFLIVNFLNLLCLSKIVLELESVISATLHVLGWHGDLVLLSSS